MPETTDLAAAYDLGWTFMSINGKTAIQKAWQKAPRPELDQVIKWADEGNIGLRTGAPSGVIVLDVDLEKGGVVPDGLPDTPVVETGGGGLHFYFRAPADTKIKNSAGKIAPHVDTRGDGGYVVYVGSVHPDTGAIYEWRQGKSPADLPLAEFPADLLAILNAPKVAPQPPAPPRPAEPSAADEADRVSKYVYSALAKECISVACAAEGTRNDTLNRAAHCVGGYLHAGLSEYDATASLVEAATQCGLDEAEARKTISSGLSSGRAKPRRIPDATPLPKLPPKPQRSTPTPPAPPITGAPIEPATPAPVADSGWPFDALGYNHGEYFFYLHRSRQIMSFLPGQLVKSHLMQLAPLIWWEAHFPGRTGADWSSAADTLITQCLNAGLFDPSLRRGRGAWWDNGHGVLHMGDALLLDGEATRLRDSRLSAFYELATPIRLSADKPLDIDARRAILDVCSGLSWQFPEHGKLFAGWIALANICGCLRWRPHVWLVGGRGTGKSTVLDTITGALLGPLALRVQSSTTEAGIRQILGHDARPVLFDEAEAEDGASQQRVQKVLELARQASSEGGAQIAKGSVGGKATTFDIRSMFLLACIGHQIVRAADASRITVMTLEKSNDTERWNNLKRKIAEVCSPATSAGLLAHMCASLDNVRANVEQFSDAVTRIAGDRRAGDQLGTLLAGWWALEDGRMIDAEDAKWLLEPWPIADLAGLAEREGGDDQFRCLSFILEQKIEVELPGGRVGKRTIGELLDEQACIVDGLHTKSVRQALNRYGIRNEIEGVMISNTHSGLAVLLGGQPWAKNWAVYLARIPGAEAGNNSAWFGGSKTRFVLIPHSTFEG